VYHHPNCLPASRRLASTQHVVVRRDPGLVASGIDKVLNTQISVRHTLFHLQRTLCAGPHDWHGRPHTTLAAFAERIK